MVLVDTSVLINYLKNVEDEFSNAFNILIEIIQNSYSRLYLLNRDIIPNIKNRSNPLI